ncbi:hypothetical protein [Streptomyces sp. NPDC050355]|uniref:hypothetical protein n=1 Tax=Streptomyces sp. NPDC050355 TaxID=3365609 RepID=UPI0037BC6D9D
MSEVPSPEEPPIAVPVTAPLRRLAEEWLGDVPNTVEAYRERIADVDAQIEETRRMRKMKLVGLTAVVAADEGADTAAVVAPLGNEPDAKGAGHETTHGGAAARFSSCSPPTPVSSTATTDRTCARYDAPPATAGW